MIYVHFFKRLADIFISLSFIIILMPLLIFILLIILFEIKENPFFLQERPGKDEKLFKIIKFKTMKNLYDAKNLLLADEFRVTRIGYFLRKYSLDELPELWNVLIGDMSLVGPRPLLKQYLPYYTATERKRHSLRPGITGLAQISGRNFLDWDSRLKLDVEYVENVSFLLDCKIMLKTIGKIIHSEGVSVIPDKHEPYLNDIRSKNS